MADELRTILDFLRKGDVLMVTHIDRLARSIGDLQDIVRAVKAKGASLKAIEQPIDTSTAAGKCFLEMFGVFAEFETNLRRERQLEGIVSAKARGVYKGRKATIDPAKIKQMTADSLVAGDVTFFEEFEPARQWQISRALLRGAEHAPSLAPAFDGEYEESARTTTEKAS
jgi:DNA invertase Pin-like site-specific DNA recombinase